MQWRERSTYLKPDDWVFASKRYRGRRPYWGQAILRKYIRPVAQRVGIQKRFGWHIFPAHVLDSAAKCGDGVQGYAGVVAAFVLPVDVGCLHAGSHAGEHAAQAAVVSLVFFSDAKGGTMLCRRGKRCQISDDKGFAEESKKDAKRARNVSVLHLQWFE